MHILVSINVNQNISLRKKSAPGQSKFFHIIVDLFNKYTYHAQQKQLPVAWIISLYFSILCLKTEVTTVRSQRWIHSATSQLLYKTSVVIQSRQCCIQTHVFTEKKLPFIVYYLWDPALTMLFYKLWKSCRKVWVYLLLWKHSKLHRSLIVYKKQLEHISCVSINYFVLT